MKCPNCGAEIGNSKVCEFCGSKITEEMMHEQEQINKQGCPKCGSSNIQFKRENQGEIKGKKANQIVHATVGFCKDCGYTWYPQGAAPQKRKTWLWVIGWICIFPIPLTILMLRKKDMKPALKYGIIAAAWIVYLIIGFSGNKNKDTDVTTVPETTEVVQETTNDDTKEISEEPTKDSDEIEDSSESTISTEDNGNTLYSNAEIVDLHNGTKTAVIGSISVIHANEADCTEEALSDWYYNYVLNHKDCNFHIIAYNDSSKGVYTLGSGTVQKDVELTEEDDGTYSIGSSDGCTFYLAEDNATTLKLYSVMADSSVVEAAKEKVDAIIPDEYKGGSLYSVDLAGEEGKLDCNLTLINDKFTPDADFQSYATEIAQSIKDLNIGIGYFCIAFQSDDATLTALSSLDDLNNQDVSEISTKTFN